MLQFIDIISLEKTYVSQRTIYAFKFNLLSDEACSIFFFYKDQKSKIDRKFKKLGITRC